MVLPDLESKPVHVSVNCNDGIMVPMISSQELLMCPEMQELQYEWLYMSADGTWGAPPFQVPPSSPRLSVPSPLSPELAAVLAPGTEHTWLLRVMVRPIELTISSQEPVAHGASLMAVMMFLRNNLTR